MEYVRSKPTVRKGLLAGALLKDRSGEIHLDLPVTGSIDDPRFSVWGIVGKIGSLAKVLVERPGLQLEIEGHVDVEKDTEGWRRLLFRRKVAARKVRDLVRSGQVAPALDNVLVEADEFPKYLAQAYKEEKFPKPRNLLGMAKDLPVPEMEKLMLTHILVTNDDLRRIALQRASNVKERLTRTGMVETGRIFLVEPKTLPPERKEKLRNSRVDFRIK
jgi:hypothetical protein